jgi:hypothetical protein
MDNQPTDRDQAAYATLMTAELARAVCEVLRVFPTARLIAIQPRVPAKALSPPASDRASESTQLQLPLPKDCSSTKGI